MGGGGAEGHPLIAGYGSSSCLLFGEQGNGGNRPQRRGESSTPPTIYPHLDVCPDFSPAEGGRVSDLLPGCLGICRHEG